MTQFTLGVLVALNLSYGTAIADDSGSARWAEVGPWHILVDKTMGNGCFMLSSYGSGTALRVGFNNRNNTAYFIIGNSAWQALEAGKQYQIGGQFDGGQMAHWTATAVKMGDGTFLSVPFSSPSPSDVMLAFGQRLNLKVYYRGNLLSSMNLNGTAAAAAETINCNRQFTATRTDPFESGTPHPVSSDPFARDF